MLLPIITMEYTSSLASADNDIVEPSDKPGITTLSLGTFNMMVPDENLKPLENTCYCAKFSMY